jgi:hypothetical protein
LKRIRFTPSMVIASIALLVALAGSAAAGTALITGAQIKNGSIGLADLSATAKSRSAASKAPLGPPVRAAPSAHKALRGRRAFRGRRANEARREVLDRRESQAHLVFVRSMNSMVSPVSLGSCQFNTQTKLKPLGIKV